MIREDRGKTIRIGIVGPGTIGHFHALAIAGSSGAELVAVLGRDQHKTADFAKKYQIAPYSDLEQFFSENHLDAITIATPSGAHLEIAEFAAAKGVHVLCEKPLEVTPQRAQKMIEACNRANVRLGLFFQGRFERCTTLAKKAIDGGRLGKILFASCQMRWARSQAYYDSAAWRGTWSLDGGGCLMNQGIHSIDLLLYLAGEAASVSAFQGHVTHDNIEVEDNICGMVRFKSGAIGTIEASTSCEPGFPRKIEISGESGTICIEDNRIVVWEMCEPQPEDDEVVPGFAASAEGKGGAADPTAIDVSGHGRVVEDFVESISCDKEVHIPGIEGKRSVLFTCAVYQSMKDNGAVVNLS